MRSAFFEPRYLDRINTRLDNSNSWRDLYPVVLPSLLLRRCNEGAALPSLRDSGVQHGAHTERYMFAQVRAKNNLTKTRLSFPLSFPFERENVVVRGSHRFPSAVMLISMGLALRSLMTQLKFMPRNICIRPDVRSRSDRDQGPAMFPLAVSNDRWHLEIGDDSMESNEIINPESTRMNALL